MIEASPIWRTRLSFKNGQKFYLYSDGVALTKQYVAFTWFCIDRHTGAIRWQWEKNSPASQLFAVHQGVVIANSVGGYMTMTRENLYLTRLEDGVALPQPRNAWERIVSRGGSAYAPVALGDNAVLNVSGDLISLATGRKIGSGNPEEFYQPLCLFGDMVHTRAGEPLPGGGLLRTDYENIWTDGKNPWRISAKDLEIGIDSKVFHYPYAYLAIYRGDREAPSERWLWTLDLRNGQIVQRVALSKEPVGSGRVHAVDDSGLIASVMHRLPDERYGIRWEGELVYFSRSSAQPDSTEDR